MTFEEYVAEIQMLAVAAGATDMDKPYCDAETWRDAYEQGVTPAEVWQGEVDAAASMGG